MPGTIGPTVLSLSLWLAQSNRKPPTVEVMFWLGVLLFACVVGFVVATWIKKRFDADEEGPSGSVMDALGLADLKRMRSEGKITDAEYELARRQVLIAAGAIDPDDPDSAVQPDTPPEEDAADGPEIGPGDDLGPELLPDTEPPSSDDSASRKRDSEPESEDESKPGNG